MVTGGRWVLGLVLFAMVGAGSGDVWAQGARADGGAARTAFLVKSYDRLLGMKGFSDTLLKNHFLLYQGYVVNVNKTLEAIRVAVTEGRNASELMELRRRLGWEWNGMRLHEYYFDNLGGKAAAVKNGKFVTAVEREFGSLSAWLKDFTAVASMRGIGWAVVFQDEETGRLFNAWVNEHDTGSMVGCRPILVLDVFEHAFFTDYQLKRAEYLQAFFDHVDWGIVEARMK